MSEPTEQEDDFQSSRGERRFFSKSWVAPLLLGLFCFAIYNANLRQIGSGDTLPARYQPLILWKDGTLVLDADARLVAHGHSAFTDQNRPAGAEGKVRYFEPWAYWMVRTRQHQVASLYPVVTPLMVAPLYLPAAIWLDAHGWQQPEVDRVAELMEKISASLLATLASVVMFLVLRRDCGRWSVPLAAAFAVGTNTWMISSQALWQHGTGELLVALALLLIVSPITNLRLVLLGLVCALMAANRPPDVLIAAAFGLVAVWSWRRRSLWLLAGAVVPLAALLWYNFDFIGHFAGAYGIGTAQNKEFFHLNWAGLPGLLVSPARGLLVFSPFLVFVPAGLLLRWRDARTRKLALLLTFATTAQLLLYSQADWRAGISWGPRWLTDLLPILVWMLSPAALASRPLARGVLVATMAFSIVVQGIGAFWYTKTSDELVFAGGPRSMNGAWNFGNIPFITELHHAYARGELQRVDTGSIERIGGTLLTPKGTAGKLQAGTVIEGWTRIDRRAPAQILLLIDGIVIGSAENLEAGAEPDDAPSGWRVAADLHGVPAGRQMLQLAARISPRSDLRIVSEQAVDVVAPDFPSQAAESAQIPVPRVDLEALAARAASLLKQRQSQQGFWLTTFTKRISYQHPRPEMNTFLTAILIDMLSPIAQTDDLGEAVERARRFLAAQIEGSGLVRYHGLPSGPTIGTLGCVITPDADTTALAWRISGLGARDPRMREMLKTLDRYRDVRGLYRTWLAPQRDYQNLDVGRDPDPVDIGIQLHVYMMLRQLDPKAAQDLCSALCRSLGDEDIWVYYAKAPLVPYLRSAEVRRLGCEISLPAERLALPAPGQEIWSEVARQLAESMTTPPNAEQRESIVTLLARLSQDDFALVRSSPPLLYHNDLSASLKRFYWSEEYGYALWLRLFAALREAEPVAPFPP